MRISDWSSDVCSSDLFSSQAFAPHFPHTVRRTETKTCSDCHLSAKDDNNAIMSQLLLLGTNFVNFVGLNAWTGLEGGFEAIRVTEWDEPQAVIGRSEEHTSELQSLMSISYAVFCLKKKKNKLVDKVIMESVIK